MNYRSKLSDQDYLDGDIGGVAQKIANDLVDEYFITISDQDHEMFVYDTKGKVWRNNAEDLIWKFTAKKYPAISKSMLNEVIHYIQGQSLTRREEFEPPKGWLSFKNQSLDAIHNYSDEFDGPDHYIRNKFPVNLNKKATCPKFSRFLCEILPDFEDRWTLLESMAMILVPHLNFEKAIMFIGTSSANGKSTIMKVMRRLFGDDNTISISLQDLIYNRFMGSKLDGKLLNIYADINAKKITDLDKFKLFVSGDYVTVERKNGHPYEIIPKTKHFFSTNTLPEINEDNNAVFRRFLIIEFPKSFENCRDLNLLDKLTTTEELEGIMWYLVRIAKRMSQQKGFTYEQTPQDIRIKWKEQSNPVFEFIEHSGLIVKKKDSRISRTEFYSKYVQFCKEKHYTIKTSNTVTRQIESLGYESQSSNGERFWLGLSITKQNEGQKSL